MTGWDVRQCRRGDDFCFFFFNDTATTEIYTLSLHDALPISRRMSSSSDCEGSPTLILNVLTQDRKSTRLNSSHGSISYAVFCLKKNIMQRYALHGAAPRLRPSLVVILV